MSFIRVLGIGSPFGDDQVGFRVIEILKQNDSLAKYPPSLLKISSEDRPGARLLELMHGAKIIFLIDAIKTGTGALPGTVHRYQNNEIDTMKPILSSHGINLPQVLGLGRLLHDFPETVILYGIEITEISFSNELTGDLEHAANKLAKLLEEQIIQLASEHFSQTKSCY